MPVLRREQRTNVAGFSRRFKPVKMSCKIYTIIYQQKEEQKVSILLGDIAKQLLRDCTIDNDVLEEVVTKRKSGGASLNSGDAMMILDEIVPTFSRIFVVVDALD